MEKMEHVILEEQINQRIDKIISLFNKEWSRTQVQQWIKEGHILVNGRKTKANYKTTLHDRVEIMIPESEELKVEPEDMKLDIYYEDQDVIIVNKPKGIVVHPAPGHLSGTLVNGLMFHCKDLSDMNGMLRPGIVHRIDKDTSGLLMVAKNNSTHVALVNQLKDKKVTRKYRAIVHGEIPHDDGMIDAPIGRNFKDRQSMTVTDNGKQAVTHFHVLERFNNYTYIECQLETGRTHQIRVHMKYIGYPLVGDPKYSQRKTCNIGGQALHAGVLGFEHPHKNEYMEFFAPLPDYFEKLLVHFRGNH